jgi:hypothetical protein
MNDSRRLTSLLLLVVLAVAGTPVAAQEVLVGTHRVAAE